MPDAVPFTSAGRDSGDTTPAAPPNVTIIVPAHNAHKTLADCLTGLQKTVGVPFSVLVVDDASGDATSNIAERFRVDVIRTGDTPVGPGRARNVAVAACRSEVVVFVDADVVVRPDSVGRLLGPLLEDPRIVATFGSYDDAPPARTVAALYANLRHHDVHQQAAGEAETFWAGCGAVRREAFLDAGGFSTAYACPSIEDVELGMRLRRSGGRIVLVPEAQCAHLKQWTVRQLWATDIWKRAVPWTKLIASGAGLGGGLNVDWRQRVSAAACWVILLSNATACFLGWLPLTAGFVAFAGWVYLNRRLLSLLRTRGGFAGLLAGGLLHFVYYLYSSVTFVLVMSARRFRREPGADGAVIVLAPVAVIAVALASALGTFALALTPADVIVRAAAEIHADKGAKYFSAERVEQLKVRAAYGGLFFCPSRRSLLRSVLVSPRFSSAI